MTKYKALPPLNRLREVFRLDNEGRLYWAKNPCAGINVSRAKIGKEITRKNDQGYIVVGLDGCTYRVHRIVWALIHNQDPGEFQIDHINGNRSDNRPVNLRLCDNGQNQLNAKIRLDNKSGIKGVFLSSSNNKKPWIAEYRNQRLGQFATKEEAIKSLRAAVNACANKKFYRSSVLLTAVSLT